MVRAVRTTGYLAWLFVLDQLYVQVALPAAMQLRYRLPFGNFVLPAWAPELFYAPTLWLHLTVFVVWALSFSFGSVYNPRRVAEWWDELARLFVVHTAAALVLAGLLYLAKAELPRLTFGYFYLISLALMAGSRIAARAWLRLRRRSGMSALRVLVAGTGAPAQALVEQLRIHARPNLTVVGAVGTVGMLGDDAPAAPAAAGALGVPVLGGLGDAVRVVQEQRADAVLLALPRTAHDELAGLVTELHQLPVRLYVVPDYFDLAFYDATVESLGPVPLIGLRDPAIDGMQRIMKRVMDIVLSGAALVLLAPLFAAVAAAIKLEDRGPVIYRTARMGEDGSVFQMLKFRSMVVGADRLAPPPPAGAADGALHKRPDDPRVTRVGRVLRRYSLDELPQLVNVLRGEMSLVGPRPELPWLVDRYAAWQHKRFAVPQGMTGWWQVNGRSDNPMHLHTEQDLYYVQHYSLWLDIQILWRTIAVVIRGKGAY
jgi:exopolysaccharide biosynthesis polyprenyl glycosylphosphotransferase